MLQQTVLVCLYLVPEQRIITQLGASLSLAAHETEKHRRISLTVSISQR